MRERHGISLEQRRALRRWAHRQHPKPTQKQCIEWFLQEYSHKLSQSTISESLGARFSHLDETDNLQGVRIREGYWPELEKVLFAWQQQVEARGERTSGELLQAKAKEIWQLLPDLQRKPVPEFSIGWLEGFKKRFKISSVRVQDGQAAPIPASAQEEMKALQTVAGEYQEEDIYNMDESGLFWRIMMSRGLPLQSQAGLKDKSRIFLVFCVNASGADRLPVWFIGKTKAPHALQSISLQTMGGQWRWNKKAWMTTTIMVEWLKAFYQHIDTTRQVLLTMDNFSAHYSAIEICPPPSNIRICWLPANSTSRFQPLNQGIIQSCKAYYRQQWLQHILQSFNSNTDPLSTMNLHLAIRWILRSWNNRVSTTTIYNCFRKSTLFSSPISLPTPMMPVGLTELYRRVIEAGNIPDAMVMTNFLNPAAEDDEEADDPNVGDDEILQEIIQEHLGLPSSQNDGEDDEQSTQPVYTARDAKQALQVLIAYSESQALLGPHCIQALERLELIVDGMQ